MSISTAKKIIGIKLALIDSEDRVFDECYSTDNEKIKRIVNNWRENFPHYRIYTRYTVVEGFDETLARIAHFKSK